MFLRSFAIILTFLFPPALHAQENNDEQGDDGAPPGECEGDEDDEELCGAPEPPPGGGNKNANVRVISRTDSGDTYFFADDFDEDGVEDPFDNCPFVFNPDQANQDGDKFGDACDVCPGVYDMKQANQDGDKFGDACDDDLDGDTIPNDQDNCPTVRNPTQRNHNGDALGDLCDPVDRGSPIHDEDWDGVADIDDNCPGHDNSDQSDLDGDRVGDACDADKDGDGILNHLDNCPDAANRDQLDRDRDGLGDVCDPRFCVVVNRNDLSDCLDPKAPFQVHTGPERHVQTGAAVGLGFYANRENELLEFNWGVESAPNGSRAVPKNARSSTKWSHAYQYGFRPEFAPAFTPDLPGRYTLWITVDRPHAGFGERQAGAATLVIYATGDPTGGGESCATASAQPPRFLKTLLRR